MKKNVKEKLIKMRQYTRNQTREWAKQLKNLNV